MCTHICMCICRDIKKCWIFVCNPTKKEVSELGVPTGQRVVGCLIIWSCFVLKGIRNGTVYCSSTKYCFYLGLGGILLLFLQFSFTWPYITFLLIPYWWYLEVIGLSSSNVYNWSEQDVSNSFHMMYLPVRLMSLLTWDLEAIPTQKSTSCLFIIISPVKVKIISLLEILLPQKT